MNNPKKVIFDNFINNCELKKPAFKAGFYKNIYHSIYYSIAAWAAAKRAIGTRNGEQET
jgi:hypothetical protein